MADGDGENSAIIAFYVLQDKKWNKMADGEYNLHLYLITESTSKFPS